MNTNDTFTIVIQHGNGDTNVWHGLAMDEMLSIQRMALIDPTLVVTVQRDDVTDEQLGAINRAKAEVERLVYGEREPEQAECNCGGFDTGKHTAWCESEPVASAISQPSGTPCLAEPAEFDATDGAGPVGYHADGTQCLGQWCQCNVEPSADYALGSDLEFEAQFDNNPWI